jgi:hypothetical protein
MGVTVPTKPAKPICLLGEGNIGGANDPEHPAPPGGGGWWSDNPAGAPPIVHRKPTSTPDKIGSQSLLTSPSGLVLMGADTPNSMDYTPGDNFSVSLSGEDETELRGCLSVFSPFGAFVAEGSGCRVSR